MTRPESAQQHICHTRYRPRLACCVTIYAVASLLTGCDQFAALLGEPAPITVTLASVALDRSDAVAGSFRVSMTLVNATDRACGPFGVAAVMTVELPGSGETATSALTFDLPYTVGGGESLVVAAEVASPFGWMPPVAARLERLTISDQSGRSAPIAYPWPVEEEAL